MNTLITLKKNRKVNQKVLILITDQLSGRIFFECGVLNKLLENVGSRVECIFTYPILEKWKSDYPSICLESENHFYSRNLSLFSKLHFLFDRYLDKKIGYFPLSIRFNLKNSFHIARMTKGHPNAHLDLSKIGILPQYNFFFKLMSNWLYSGSRFVNPLIYTYLEEEVSIMIVSNLQHPSAIQYLIGARRNDTPVIGYIASWDHLVGKGIVYPGCRKYIVQNNEMKENLLKLHDIREEKIAVTGWPQSDLYSQKFAKADYLRLLASYNLDATLPVVLVAGNSATNAPYEPVFFRKLIEWWLSAGNKGLFNMIFRPHPRDIHWRERFNYDEFAKLEGIYIQEACYTDFEILTLLLQHVDCVVSNAGTILLDSLGNDRAVIAVLYDEGSTEKDINRAALNILGDHYRVLRNSDAFFKAYSFNEVVEYLRICINNPNYKEYERKNVCKKIMGNIDGKAGARVAAVIQEEIEIGMVSKELR